MKVYGVNGSPRKKNNTAVLLNKALEGAAAQGAETEVINLYDFDFKGCTSCFACKVKNGKSFGKCAMKDDLSNVLDKIKDADAIILGSPVYFGSTTGVMRSFLERFWFPYMQYSKKESVLFGKKIPTGFIYTLNASKLQLKMFRGHFYLNFNALLTKMLTQHSETLYSYNTYQFDDYSKYVTDGVNVEKKEKTRKNTFPKDCDKAYEMGVRFAKKEVKFKKLRF